MKIVCVDNYARENVSDRPVCENVSKEYGKKITELLNEKLGGPEHDDYYRLVKDDYKLQTWET